MFCISFRVSISRYKDSDYSNITNNYPQKFNNYSNKMHNLLYNPSFCQFQMTQNYRPTTSCVSLGSNKKRAQRALAPCAAFTIRRSVTSRS